MITSVPGRPLLRRLHRAHHRGRVVLRLLRIGRREAGRAQERFYEAVSVVIYGQNLIWSKFFFFLVKVMFVNTTL
jgi:hypothetical protein